MARTLKNTKKELVSAEEIQTHDQESETNKKKTNYPKTNNILSPPNEKFPAIYRLHLTIRPPPRQLEMGVH